MSKARELAQKPNQPTGRKNLIINGAMNVAQRGTSSATGLTEQSDGYKTVDRWKYVASGVENAGQLTMSYETDAPDDFKYSTKYLVTTADADMGASGMLRLETHLEAQDLRHLNYGSSAAKQVTLSFWVKSNKTGSYSAGLYMDSVASGSDNEISQAYTISSADTWEYKTLTFAANTTTVMNATGNDHGLRVWFMSAAGSNTTSGSSNTWGGLANRAVGQSVNLYDTVNNYWQVTGVQLEVGSVATEFEHRSYGEELALCQRYYTEFKFPTTTPFFPSHRQTTNTVRSTVITPVPMRTTPSINTTGQPHIRYYWNNGLTFLVDDGTSLTAIGSSLDVNRFTISNPDVTGASGNIGGVFAYAGTLECNAEL